jgi:hypothetical protein
VLEVTSAKRFSADNDEVYEVLYELKQLDFGWGSFLHFGDDFEGHPHPHHEAIGSTQIDDTFRQQVEQRLRYIESHECYFDFQQAAREMTTAFQNIKTVFGHALTRPTMKYVLRVAGLPRDFKNSDAKIENGNMIFT